MTTNNVDKDKNNNTNSNNSINKIKNKNKNDNNNNDNNNNNKTEFVPQRNYKLHIYSNLLSTVIKHINNHNDDTDLSDFEEERGSIEANDSRGQRSQRPT